MGLSFRKSIKLGRGLKLNLSKNGVGISGGTKGMRMSIGPKGIRETASIPGTGIRYTSQKSIQKKNSPRPNQRPVTHTSAEWLIFAVIAAIMIAVPIYNPKATMVSVWVIVFAFIGYLIVHGIRKIKK